MALQLIRRGQAYVDDPESADEIREYRSTLTAGRRTGAPIATDRLKKTWICSRACAREEVPGRQPYPASQN